MALYDEILADAPLGYWRDKSGTDSSGNSISLTPFSADATLPQDGTSLDASDAVNPSIVFRGPAAGGDNIWDSSSHAVLNIGAGHTYSRVSLVALIKPSVVGDVQHDVVGKANHYGVYLGTDSKLHGFLNVGGLGVQTVIGATTISAGTEYAVGLTWDTSNLLLYVNGAVDGTLAAASSYISTDDSTHFVIGTQGAGANGYAGTLDEVALFPSVLSADRFNAYYVAALNPPPQITKRYSGGTGNTSGAAALGGAEGGTLATGINALFGAPTPTQIAAGLTDYRAIYLHAAENITGVQAWLSAVTSETDTAEAIGADTTNPAHTIANATTAPATVTFSTPTTQGAALALGDLSSGQAVPLWVRRVITANAAEGTRSFTITVAWTAADASAQTATIPLSYALTKPVTLYVNADHAAADDTYTRATVADDPAHPFKTVRAAVWQLQPGDTCQIEPATVANALDASDTSVYASFDAYNATPPAADSSASSQPTRIIGHVVSGQRPKIFSFLGSHLRNWQIENIQFGYDRGSGHDHDTMGSYAFNYDLHFVNCVWTGGTWWVRGFGGLLWMDGCTWYHPFTNANFLSGVGMWVFETEAGGIAPDRPGVFRVTGCHIEDCLGEDGMQLSNFQSAGCKIEIGVNSDTGQVIGNRFIDLVQSGAAHTDALQCLGGAADISIIGNYFRNCASPIILSDGHFTGRVIIGLNIIGEGSVWAVQVEGCDNVWMLHNTCRTVWQMRVYTREASVSQHIRIVNNIVPQLTLDATDIDPASVVENNVTYETPGAVTPWGTQVDGFPEFGTSARTDTAGYTDAYELSNALADSAGIGQGRSLAGLGLTSDELAYFTDDLLGRAYATPRDTGALQSDAGVLVDPSPRPPYVSNLFPAPNSAAGVSTMVSADLVPVIGQTIDATTVNSGNVFLADAEEHVVIPVVITLAAPDAQGKQLLTIDAKSSLSPLVEGTLWPRVWFLVTLQNILDTQGSEAALTTWLFRTTGPTGPAIYDPDGAPSGDASGWIVGVLT